MPDHCSYAFNKFWIFFFKGGNRVAFRDAITGNESVNGTPRRHVQAEQFTTTDEWRESGERRSLNAGKRKNTHNHMQVSLQRIHTTT